MTLRLYELGSAVHALAEMMEEGEEGWQAALDELTENFQDKVVNCAKLIKVWEAEEEAYKAEIDRLSAHMKAAKSRQDWMKDYLKRNMEEAGVDHIKGDVVDIRLQNSPLSVKVPDDMAVDPRYRSGSVKMPWEEIVSLGLTHRVAVFILDRGAILADFKATGEAIPGVTIEQGRHVRIR